MNTKIFLIVGVIVVVVAGAVFFSRGGGEQPDTINSGDSSGLIIGKNAIVVDVQPPSNAVAVRLVLLEKPGFVVIHDGDGTRLAEGAVGVPGAILGASGLLPTGETENLAPITLSRATKDDETIYAMIHLDDGDGVFDAAKDKPAEDVLGGPVMAHTLVWVGADTPEPGTINP